MSFLKKVFGKKESTGDESRVSQTDQKQEPLSPALKENMKEKVVERAPRIQIGALHNISFEMRLANGELKKVPLANLSVTGAGFLREPGIEWPSPGATLEGVFKTQNDSAEVSAKIVHLSHKVVGCQFQGKTGELRNLVLKYFKIELSALKLIKVRADLLKAEPDGQPLWFRGVDNCELFLIEKDEALVRFTLTLFGNHFEGTAQGDLKFGHVVEDEMDTPKMKGSSLVRSVSTVSHDVVDAAVKFVQNIESLPEKYRLSLIAILQTAA